MLRLSGRWKIRLYIKIQKMRFQERLLYEEDIDHRADEHPDSQPVPDDPGGEHHDSWHEVRPSLSRCEFPRIRFRTRRRSRIEDDGGGMTEEQMAEIRGRLAFLRGNGGPLHGIQKHLAALLLHCHGRASIELQARQPSGTLIRLTFSDTKGEDEHV